jgi:hypothetical protein
MRLKLGRLLGKNWNKTDICFPQGDEQLRLLKCKTRLYKGGRFFSRIVTNGDDIGRVNGATCPFRTKIRFCLPNTWREPFSSLMSAYCSPDRLWLLDLCYLSSRRLLIHKDGGSGFPILHPAAQPNTGRLLVICQVWEIWELGAHPAVIKMNAPPEPMPMPILSARVRSGGLVSQRWRLYNFLSDGLLPWMGPVRGGPAVAVGAPPTELKAVVDGGGVNGADVIV